jgi:large conductance mechanosensitive channel
MLLLKKQKLTTMGFIKDFKTFALKGNLADLAIGVVIGAAFGKVISAFIDGMVLPIVGMITGKDFSNMYIPLSDKVKDALVTNPALGLADAQKIGPVFAHGNFISALVNFLLIAMVCYLVIKKLMKKDPNAVPAPTPTESLLAEIRDSLKK